jgi:hypothetical protein
MSVARTVTLCGRQLHEPGHICAFFDSREEEYEILAPFYREGVTLGEEIITVVESERKADHLERLKAHELDVPALVNAGQLHALTADEWYMKDGRFGATRMYEMVQGALADLQKKGRRARGAGVMDWAMDRHVNVEDLLDYESRVNFLIHKYDATLLCIYDINQISGRMMLELLATHPYVIQGRTLRENSHYVPPLDRLREVMRQEDSAAQHKSLN